MSYLIGQLFGPLLLAALFGGVAGWFWHNLRMRPRWDALKDERRRLRAELLDAANGGRIVTGSVDEALRRRVADLERALAESRGRSAEADVLRLRVAELERTGAAQIRSVAAVDVTEYTSKIATLETQIETAQRVIHEAEALQARVAELEAAAAVASDDDGGDASEYENRIAALELDLEEARAKSGEGVDVAGLKWRLRYFEKRAQALEAAPVVKTDDDRVFKLEQDLEAAVGQAAAADELRAQVKALEAQVKGAPSPAEDDMNQLRWRNRYLNARVKYLETINGPPPQPVATLVEAPDQEREDRKRWRARYLEQRVGYLEGLANTAGEAANSERDSAKARVGELESALSLAQTQAQDQAKTALAEGAALQEQLKAALAEAVKGVEIEDDLIRTRWKSRYLEARVRYLEGRMAQTSVSAAPSAPEPQTVLQPEPAPAPAPKPIQQRITAPPREPEVLRMERPAALSGPRNGASDDLRLIEGVSLETESSLHAMGVHHFDQIAGWNQANVAWVDKYLNLRGRIAREAWVNQARRLTHA